MRLAELAQRFGFVLLPPRLESLSSAGPIPIADLNSTPEDAFAAIDLMRRRGLHPALVRVVRDWLGDRKLERGLLAWDVLNNALFSLIDDAPLIAELRNDAEIVSAVLPPPGALGARTTLTSAARLVDHVARTRFREASDEECAEVATRTRDLGALAELRHRFDREALVKTGIISSTRELAHLLSLARLPTLASFYVDYLADALDDRDSLVDLVEIMADAGASGALPDPPRIMKGGTVEEVELVGYATVRAAAIDGRFQAMYDDLASRVKLDDIPSMSREETIRQARFLVSFAEHAAELGRFPVRVEQLVWICADQPLWRYAHRVLCTVVAGVARPTDDADVLALFDRFVAQFGNDFQMWFRAGRQIARGTALAHQVDARLASEIVTLPHDLQAWSALALRVSPTVQSGLDEIVGLRRAQATLSRRSFAPLT